MRWEKGSKNVCMCKTLIIAEMPVFRKFAQKVLYNSIGKNRFSGFFYDTDWHLCTVNVRSHKRFFVRALQISTDRCVELVKNSKSVTFMQYLNQFNSKSNCQRENTK